MSTFRQVNCTRFCGSSIHSVHAVKSTCQHIRIFKIIRVEYHTFDKLPVTMYLNIIICWCTVPVEICAAILYVGLWGIVFWRWLDSGIFYLEWIQKCDITPANMSSVWVSGRCKVTSVIFHWVKIISVCRTRTFSDKCDTKATLEQMCVQDGSANRGENFAWKKSHDILPVWPSAGDFGRKKWPPSNLLAKTLILVYFTYFPLWELA